MTARNYAAKKGGETIKSSIIAINDFLEFIKKGELRANHKRKLQQDLSKPNNTEGYNKIKKALKLIDNNNFLKDICKKLQKIKDKHTDLIKNGYPVVYVLKVKPEWFKNWNYPNDDINFKAINLAAIKPITPENIIAKIDFPKGATRYD